MRLEEMQSRSSKIFSHSNRKPETGNWKPETGNRKLNHSNPHMATITFTTDEPPICFDEVAFISIVSDEPDFVLADDLNLLFDLELCRVMDLSGFGYPRYCCSDNLRNLGYHLVHIKDENPGYLLIILGPNADEEAMRFYTEFNTTPKEPNKYDLPEVERYNVLMRYCNAFTLVNIVKFSKEEIEMASSRRRTHKGRVALADFYARLLDSIDIDSIDIDSEER